MIAAGEISSNIKVQGGDKSKTSDVEAAYA